MIIPFPPISAVLSSMHHCHPLLVLSDSKGLANLMGMKWYHIVIWIGMYPRDHGSEVSYLLVSFIGEFPIPTLGWLFSWVAFPLLIVGVLDIFWILSVMSFWLGLLCLSVNEKCSLNLGKFIVSFVTCGFILYFKKIFPYPNVINLVSYVYIISKNSTS